MRTLAALCAFTEGAFSVVGGPSARCTATADQANGSAQGRGARHEAHWDAAPWRPPGLLAAVW